MGTSTSIGSFMWTESAREITARSTSTTRRPIRLPPTIINQHYVESSETPSVGKEPHPYLLQAHGPTLQPPLDHHYDEPCLRPMVRLSRQERYGQRTTRPHSSRLPNHQHRRPLATNSPRLTHSSFQVLLRHLLRPSCSFSPHQFRSTRWSTFGEHGWTTFS